MEYNQFHSILLKLFPVGSKGEEIHSSIQWFCRDIQSLLHTPETASWSFELHHLQFRCIAVFEEHLQSGGKSLEHNQVSVDLYHEVELAHQLM